MIRPLPNDTRSTAKRGQTGLPILAFPARPHVGCNGREVRFCLLLSPTSASIRAPLTDHKVLRLAPPQPPLWSAPHPLWEETVLTSFGDVGAGLRLLAEALEACATNGRGDVLAEAYRLQGELLL